MTISELNNIYGFNETVDQLKKRYKTAKDNNTSLLHPVYDRHLRAAWIIQDIWGHVQNENMSLGKGRELTTSVIESHFNKLQLETQPKKIYQAVLDGKQGTDRAKAARHLERAKEAVLNAQAAIHVTNMPLLDGENTLLDQITKIIEILTGRNIG